MDQFEICQNLNNVSSLVSGHLGMNQPLRYIPCNYNELPFTVIEKGVVVSRFAAHMARFARCALQKTSRERPKWMSRNMLTINVHVVFVLTQPSQKFNSELL